MEFVPYIDKTRDYYLKEGFSEPYRWAHFDSAPFTPLKKPLSECRVALITTAGFEIVPEGGFSYKEVRELRKGTNTGTYALEVFSVPSDTPKERVLFVKENHDRAQSDMGDADAFFPVTRLREFRDEGVLGSLASDYFRVRLNYSQRKVVEVDGAEVLRRCRADGVDVALLSPV